MCKWSGEVESRPAAMLMACFRHAGLPELCMFAKAQVEGGPALLHAMRLTRQATGHVSKNAVAGWDLAYPGPKQAEMSMLQAHDEAD